MARLNDTSSSTDSAEEGVVAGKGRPTPTRKEKEAARKRPLVANDRAERKRRERETTAIERERQRVGMANGEERYLPARDRGPQRRYIRDYIDARWSIGELLLPMIAVFFVINFVSTIPEVVAAVPEISYIALLVMWLALLVSFVDVVFLWSSLGRKVKAKFGATERGFRFYVLMRAIYLRPMRLPKPQVARGDFPE